MAALDSGGEDYDFVDDCGEYCSLDVMEDGVWEMIAMSASASRPFSPNAQELKLAIVAWMKQEKPELLHCQVENLMKERGHICLWLPPYCPELQPIELFWGAGKNYAADHYWNGRTMKETVQLVREGWHGNSSLWGESPDTADYFKDDEMDRLRRKCAGVDCAKLVATSIKYANDKFIKIAGGLDGTIDNLIIEEGYVCDTVDMPIDMVINLHEADDSDSDSEDDLEGENVL
jgi:hypothetical protein